MGLEASGDSASSRAGRGDTLPHCHGLWTRPQPIQTRLDPEASPEVALAQFLYLKNGPEGPQPPSEGPSVSGTMVLSA